MYHVGLRTLENLRVACNADKLSLRNVYPRWQSEMIIAGDMHALHAQEDSATIHANVAGVLDGTNKVA